MKTPLNKTVRFSHYHCHITLQSYRMGGVRISLIDVEDNMPVAIASVWIEGLASDEIAIKNYSENEGMLDALLLSDIVHPPHRWQEGHPIVRLAGNWN